MTLGVLLCATIGICSWSLWARRDSWVYAYERSICGMMLMALLCVCLLNPLSTWTIGAWLHSLTGAYNLDIYAGCMFGVGSAAAAVWCAVRRLRSTDWLRDSFYKTVTLPMRVLMPVLFMLFWCSKVTDHSYPYVGKIPQDGWLHMYWVVLCSFYIYLLGYTFRACFTLRMRRDLPQVHTYMRGCVIGIIANLCRIGVSYWPQIPGLTVVWMATSCWCIACFAVGSGRAWRQRKRWFSPAQDLPTPRGISR